MKAYRIMEHRRDDRMVISPSFESREEIGIVRQLAVVKYDAELEPHGGRNLVASKFYRRIAILDASSLAVESVVYDGNDWLM